MMSLALQISCITRHYYPETLENLKKLCSIANIEYRINENATCCGLPYFEKGELKAAKTIGEYNLTLYGQDQLMSTSSKCRATFAVQYPKIFNNTVSHNTAVQLSKNTGGFIDLCLKIPARILDAVTGKYFLVRDCCNTNDLSSLFKRMENCEWHSSSLQSDCCGAGASMPVSNHSLSSEITLNLIREFKDSGATAMVFEDDICRKQVDNIAYSNGIAVKTMHFADLILQFKS